MVLVDRDEREAERQAEKPVTAPTFLRGIDPESGEEVFCVPVPGRVYSVRVEPLRVLITWSEGNKGTWLGALDLSGEEIERIAVGRLKDQDKQLEVGILATDAEKLLLFHRQDNHRYGLSAQSLRSETPLWSTILFDAEACYCGTQGGRGGRLVSPPGVVPVDGGFLIRSSNELRLFRA